MALTKLEKIADIQKQIEQLKNQQKLYRQQHNEHERKARTKRLCSRHGLLEKMLPEIITITDEQYQAFLEKAVTNTYGRDILNKIIVPNPAAVTLKMTGIAARGNSIPAANLAEAEQENDEDNDEYEDAE